ncbi:MAG TPA: S9 family peptidase, partial [Alphaproteobacteria bacterium]
MNPRDTALPAPPAAKRIPKATTTHGDTLVDDYAWLRDKDDPDVRRYLEAENAYTDAAMRPFAGFQEALYKEMLARIKETDLSVPYKEGAYFYYSRTVQGLQYPIFCRKRGSLEAAEAIVLDVNELAKGRPYMDVGPSDMSEDGDLYAYSTDETGFRQYTLVVKDLRTGTVSAPLAERVTAVAWANDNRTLLYTTEDETTKRSNKLFRHVLGAPAGELVYEETDELYRLHVGKSRSRAYIFVVSGSATTSEVRCLPADAPAAAPKLMLKRREGHEYYPDHHGVRFFIRTNDKGRNFRLVEAPTADPAEANWREVRPHRDAVMLEDIDLFAGHLVVSEREEGLPRLVVTELAGGATHAIEFPERVYSAYPHVNAEFETAKFRFGYESFVTPRSVFEYDLATRVRVLLKQTEVLGGFDATRYDSERIYVTASDGARIPISLVFKKGARRDGGAPLLLGGYGSYGFALPIAFNSNRMTLLDRGMISAVVHVRGGGDMGKIWHEQGRMMAKKNTFTDFIAAAEHLMAERWTRSDRLVITGGSAGGLLMGAVVNLRPDLFRAVVAHVPFVDVMNTMLDASLPLTVAEYLEWGNPNEKDAYHYMKSYSPYDNIEAKAYPNILVKTSLSDSQVMYWEAAKYVAKLRALKTDANLLLLKTNMDAGHGGA